jgi:hypothetical protein
VVSRSQRDGRGVRDARVDRVRVRPRSLTETTREGRRETPRHPGPSIAYTRAHTMDPWSKLAEARIQEWLKRPEKERAEAPREELTFAPLEVQLLDDARALYAKAREATDPLEQGRLRAAASRVETRILVILEESGRPLAAQEFARMLAEARHGR